MSSGTATALTISVERADQADVLGLLDTLDAYLASLYAPEDNYILGVSALLAEDVVFLVARDAAGHAVACGAIRCMPGEASTHGRPYAEVKRMVVRPDRRGHRIGDAVLARLEAAAAAQGLGLALLETGRDQASAVRLYERAGYRRRPPFAGYPDNGLSLFYEKVIQA